MALRRIYAALSRWDLDELVEDVAHDIEWSLPTTIPWGGTRHGHDDRMIVLGLIRGRAKETGQGFEVEFAHVWTLTDGVASRCRGYYDTAPITAALEGRPVPEPDAGI